MKKLTLVLISFLLPIVAPAQKECYSLHYQEGKSACERREFHTALRHLLAADRCPDKPKSNDLENWLSNTNNGLDERNNWVHALDADNREGWEALLHRFPEGHYAAQAAGYRSKLKAVEARTLVQNIAKGAINWTLEFVETTGEAAINREKWPDETQAIRMATSVAEAIAKDNLLEIISAMSLRRQTTVSNLMIERDDVYANLYGIVQSAQTYGDPLVQRNTVSVTLRVPLYGPGSVAWVVQPVLSDTLPDTTDLPETDPIEWTLLLPRGSMPPFTIFPIFTNVENALLHDGSTSATANAAPLTRWYRAKPNDFFTGANIFESKLNEMGHLMLPEAAEPIFRKWLQARKTGAGALPVRVVVR